MDGYCRDGNAELAFEYLGCVWHGCRVCFQKQTATYENEREDIPKEPLTKHTLAQRYVLYKKKKDVLLSLGFKVI